MDWTMGHPQKHAIVSHLLEFRIASKDIVPIDSIVVDAIYGQHARKSARHRHIVQQFSFDASLDPVLRHHIYTAFETYKALFDINDAASYFKTSSDVAKLIYNGIESIRTMGDGSYNTLLWCIAAYALVVLPTSAAHLYKRRMTDDKEGHLGFGVQATRDIVKGEYVYELSGLLAIDNDTPHTRLSETTPFGNSSEDQRVFFGPIRFVNHQCIDFNAEYVAVENTDGLGFTIIACKDIRAGEEIYVDYGSTYFEDKPDGCPCLTCRPPDTNSDKKPEIHTRPALDLNARRNANRTKRSRQAANRKKRMNAC